MVYSSLSYISPWAEGIVLQVDYVILCPGLSKGNPKNTKREATISSPNRLITCNFTYRITKPE